LFGGVVAMLTWRCNGGEREEGGCEAEAAASEECGVRKRVT